MGSDSNFGCTSNFYKQHGNYYISDYNTAVEEGRIAKDYFVLGVMKIKSYFEFAKADITKLAKSGKPFNMELVTLIRIHLIGMYVKIVSINIKANMQTAIACQSKQVNNFYKLGQRASHVYENTTIVITGDHNSMSEKFFTNLDHDYVRTPYNCFINSAVTTKFNKNRKFSIIDMYLLFFSSNGGKNR